MKNILKIFLIGVFLMQCFSAFATYPTHRTVSDANDAAYPTDTDTAINTRRGEKVRFYFDIGGTTPTYDASVLVWDGIKFYLLEKVTISADVAKTYRVYGEYVYVLLDGKSGTTPTMTVRYQVTR